MCACVYVKLEIRDHGVGFFQFSKDEETRQQQLEALKKLRQQVILTVNFTEELNTVWVTTIIAYIFAYFLLNC